MDKENNNKWYNNPTIVDTLLFILPPVGMYGLYKTEGIKSNLNKVLYGFLGFISLLMVVIYLT
ncbi:hypothetical protein [Aequorivita marina]|uniref:hypothetical protein n=1 Tax=Aequorivita marina TaxID=3073654 RepID=UPI0028762865|nr:hypothetical protein [Aequorivita sp. S2608]MDS1298750.1 hypothetical protein [Aequorivita sp. S2608]